MDKKSLYRNIPKVDTLLENESIQRMIEIAGRNLVMDVIREEIEKLREFIARSEDEEEITKRTNHLIEAVGETLDYMHTPNMKMVVNGTGTILHTNLGRAPISQEHMDKVYATATWYSNLEYDIEQGKRGERYSHFEKILCRITGAEAAMAVNNNAAAVMLILNAMAKNGEVIVSRGELVEIGGKFRIPDVMEQSGATLVEVGTTNKTHYADYEDAISEDTKAILKVHTSNYRIVGFTNTVSMEELTPLREKYKVPLIEDLGSGMLIDLSKYGLTYEPTVQDALKNGADIVCFSGDKLLGGPQAGIIVGKRKYIEQMKKNQLTRALRIDKFTAAALEAVLLEYLSEEKAIQNIPTLRMITKSVETIEKEAEEIREILIAAKLPLEISIETCESQIGGGSMPLERLESRGLILKPTNMSVSKLENRMRRMPLPLITRIVNDTILIDVRTVEVNAFQLLITMWKDIGMFEEECIVENDSRWNT
jgi:seryl-tRNA(sec) selenium transferase